MKVESGLRPSAFKINIVGDEALVEFAENVVELPTEDGAKFEYDSYILKVKNSASLEQRISSNYATWLEKAKALETAPKPRTIDERVDTVEVTTDEIVDVLATIVGV